MNVDEQVARRLADAVRLRRAELGMSQSDVVHAAKQAGHDLSVQTMSAIERGQRPQLRPVTVGALEAALRWPPDTVQAIISGSEVAPPAGNQPGLGTARANNTDEMAEMRRELRELRQAVGLSEPEPMTADVRTVAGVLRMFSPEQRRVFAEALAVVEAEA